MRKLLAALLFSFCGLAHGQADYYSATGNPAPNSALSSSTMRAEFVLIQSGFAKLPTITGAGSRVPYINSGATAITTAAGFTFDGTSIVTLGVAGASVGGVAFKNATSGTITLSPVTGALGTVTLSLPAATDTLVGKATTDELTNKTLNASVGKGTWTASGTWTLPAITLGGTVSGGGNQINNVIIGTSTPLAGTFTALTANGTIKASAAAGSGGLEVGRRDTGATAWTIYSVAGSLQFYDGTFDRFVIANGGTASFTGNVSIAATQQLFLDGGVDTYLAESSANVIQLVTGGTERARFTASGYLKASNSGMYNGATAAYHELYQDNNTGVGIAVFKHAGATAANQSGFTMVLTGDPNSSTIPFFQFIGNATVRADIRSDGSGLFTGGLVVNATSKIYLDGGGDTYIDEASANNIRVTAGGTDAARFTSAGLTLPSIGSDAGHTDATVCVDTTSKTLYYGSGAAGICLGTSSERYKTDVAALDVGLRELMSLRPVSYRLKADPSKVLYGFTAEQGLGALPLLVGEDAQGRPNTFDYLGVVPVLVKAVQEQQRQIEELRAANDAQWKRAANGN